MDKDLLQQTAVSLDDCRITLGELEGFVKRLKSIAKPSSIFRRAKVAINLTMYAGEIASFEEKINKSNWALQTMLSVIQV
jgi:hypothetical protein